MSKHDVKVGVLGKRGLAGVVGLKSVSGVDVWAFADRDPSTHRLAHELNIPLIASDLEDLIDACDAIIVATPMHVHAEQSIRALAAGKHVLSEVTAAVQVEECAALQRAALASKATYSFAENYCYFEQNLIAQVLAKSGRFGELYFGEGDYVHEVRFLHRGPDGGPTWRKQWQVGSRGNTYCTHELGPLMRCFRAVDPHTRVVSVACFGTGTHTDPNLDHDDSTLTMVQLSNGGLLKLRLDMVSNRPERIAYSLQGTLGAYESAGDDHRFWFGPNATVSWDDPHPRRWASAGDFFGDLPSELGSEIIAARQSGHGGGDYFVGRRFGQTLIGEREPEIGLFDAIEWTMVGLLSQQSIAAGGRPMPMPSFVYEVDC